MWITFVRFFFLIQLRHLCDSALIGSRTQHALCLTTNLPFAACDDDDDDNDDMKGAHHICTDGANTYNIISFSLMHRICESLGIGPGLDCCELRTLWIVAQNDNSWKGNSCLKSLGEIKVKGESTPWLCSWDLGVNAIRMVWVYFYFPWHFVRVLKIDKVIVRKKKRLIIFPK